MLPDIVAAWIAARLASQSVRQFDPSKEKQLCTGISATLGIPTQDVSVILVVMVLIYLFFYM